MVRQVYVGFVAVTVTFAVVILCCAGKGPDYYAGYQTQDVLQALIDEATTDVQLPQGEFVCYKPVIIPSGRVVRGSGIDKTIIINRRTGWIEQAFRIIGKEGESVRITGMTFTGANLGTKDMSDLISIEGDSKQFRIDNCKFINGGAHAIKIDGYTYGVIDHNLFIDDSQESISIRDGEGDESWGRPLSYGTANAVYIEDNTFDYNTRGDHAVTSVNGGRYVFRYNSVYSTEELNATQVDTHGNFFNERSGFSSEIYGNYLYSEQSFYGIYIRGGRGVIFDNVLEGNYDLPICLANYRSFDTPKGESSGPCGYSACSYPAPDQINNYFIWDNTYQGSTASVTVQDRGLEQDHIQLNRDYYTSELGSYTEYTYPHPLTLM
jgi:hypothetical protein